jgi:hypothetical protein
MKIHITVIDDSGIAFEGDAELSRVSKPSKSKITRVKAPARGSAPQFSLNVSAFMNKHAKGMSGSQKFVLLVAHAAKGKSGHEVSSDDLVSAWNRMKRVMGGKFNGAHAVRAKDKGWIDSPKRGVYVLSDTWKDAMTEE